MASGPVDRVAAVTPAAPAGKRRRGPAPSGPPSRVARPTAAPSRFGYARIEQELFRMAQPSSGAAMKPPAPPPDRRQALARLTQRLGAEESVLLERGFDRAYRRLVEGV